MLVQRESLKGAPQSQGHHWGGPVRGKKRRRAANTWGGMKGIVGPGEKSKFNNKK